MSRYLKLSHYHNEYHRKTFHELLGRVMIVSEVTAKYPISRSVVLKWCNEGRVIARQCPPTNLWLISRDDLEAKIDHLLRFIGSRDQP